MKKILLLILSSLALVMMIPALAMAAPNPSQTVIAGEVTYNGQEVTGAHVIVICNSIVKRATTDNTGSYTVLYTKNQCPVGSNVTVTATHDRRGGEDSKDVSPGQYYNVDLINVSLPELGIVTTAGAALVGGAAFLLIRRHSLGSSQV